MFSLNSFLLCCYILIKVCVLLKNGFYCLVYVWYGDVNVRFGAIKRVSIYAFGQFYNIKIITTKKKRKIKKNQHIPGNSERIYAFRLRRFINIQFDRRKHSQLMRKKTIHCGPIPMDVMVLARQTNKIEKKRKNNTQHRCWLPFRLHKYEYSSSGSISLRFYQ